MGTDFFHGAGKQAGEKGLPALLCWLISPTAGSACYTLILPPNKALWIVTWWGGLAWAAFPPFVQQHLPGI
jgi:hypothetical protein